MTGATFCRAGLARGTRGLMKTRFEPGLARQLDRIMESGDAAGQRR